MYIMCLIIFLEKQELQDQYPLSLNRDRDRLQKYWAIIDRSLKIWLLQCYAVFGFIILTLSVNQITSIHSNRNTKKVLIWHPLSNISQLVGRFRNLEERQMP